MSATSPHTWVLPAVVDACPLHQLPLPLALRTLLLRRGLSEADVAELITPPELPDPCGHFPDLEVAVERICRACEQGEALAVCGDYDADGMTSTALLLRALQPLGAKAEPAIPSRMEEGYGLNPCLLYTSPSPRD